MKKSYFKILIIFILICSAASLQAQNFEFGINAGASQYMGDLSERNVVLETTQPVVGITMKYNLSPYFALRTGISAAYVSGSDENNSDPGLRNRNLSFRSEVIEGSLVAELNFADLDRTGFTPYIFGGVAGFYFNPRANYNSDWIALQPLTTEGQGTSAKPGTQPYDRFAFAIPFGGGIKAKLSDKIILGVEVGLRKTFTDYLDDVGSTYANPQVLINERGPLSAQLADRSNEVMPEPPNRTGGETRGDPEVTDYYGFGVVSISFLLGNGSKGYRASKNYGCPMKF